MSTVPATKKEQILRLAHADPFMRISDIAATVDTTARYVRTTLSENGVSLVELRRERARSMERRLGLPQGDSSLIPPALAEAPLSISQEPRIRQIVNQRVAKALHLPTNAPLLCVSLARNAVLHRVLTPLQVVVPEGLLTSNGSLVALLGLERVGITQVVERNLEVIMPDASVARELRITTDSPVIRYEQVFETQGVRTALEARYCDAFEFRLRLDGANHIALLEKIDA